MANNSSQTPRRQPGLLWPTLIGGATLLMLGAVRGHTDKLAANGEQGMSPIVGTLLVLLTGAVAMFLYLRPFGAFWEKWSPRKRLYVGSFSACVAFGAALMSLLHAAKVEPLADPLASSTALSPSYAIVLAALWSVGLVIATVVYLRSIDDHERHAFHMASVAGFYGFVLPCPAWWVLARAGVLPPVDAMPLFIFAMAVNVIVFFWYRFR